MAHAACGKPPRCPSSSGHGALRHVRRGEVRGRRGNFAVRRRHGQPRRYALRRLERGRRRRCPLITNGSLGCSPGTAAAVDHPCPSGSPPAAAYLNASVDPDGRPATVLPIRAEPTSYGNTSPAEPRRGQRAPGREHPRLTDLYPMPPTISARWRRARRARPTART